MSDFADEASRIEELHREAALAAQRARFGGLQRSAGLTRGDNPAQLPCCVDCGEQIPLGRLRIFPTTSHCTVCLGKVERRLRISLWIA